MSPLFAKCDTRPPPGGRVLLRSPAFADPCARLLVAVLAAALAGPAIGASISMDLVAPVGGVANKRVESMQERRYAHLVQQHKDFSCGAAALATVLRYAYDEPSATEERILRGLFAVSDPAQVRMHGFSLLDLKRFVDALGLRGRGYRVPSDALADIRVPTIALIEVEGYRHFVVLRRVVDDRAYLGDPALGNRTMRLPDFIEAWNGVVFAVIGPGFERLTALLRHDAVAAPGLSDVYARVPRSTAIGFGIRRAELF